MRPDLTNPWRPEEEHALALMWEGDITTKMIASQLPGRTKNAVVSKRRRMKLPSRPSPIIRKAS